MGPLKKALVFIESFLACDACFRENEGLGRHRALDGGRTWLWVMLQLGSQAMQCRGQIKFANSVVLDLLYVGYFKYPSQIDTDNYLDLDIRKQYKNGLEPCGSGFET